MNAQELAQVCLRVRFIMQLVREAQAVPFLLPHEEVHPCRHEEAEGSHDKGAIDCDCERGVCIHIIDGVVEVNGVSKQEDVGAPEVEVRHENRQAHLALTPMVVFSHQQGSDRETQRSSNASTHIGYVKSVLNMFWIPSKHGHCTE